MTIADLHTMIEPIQLSDAVPEEIRREFDTARNAFVYAWFVYEFATLQSWLATQPLNWRSAGGWIRLRPTPRGARA